jgi:hypothetical protein
VDALGAVKVNVKRAADGGGGGVAVALMVALAACGGDTENVLLVDVGVDAGDVLLGSGCWENLDAEPSFSTADRRSGADGERQDRR